MKRKDYFLSYSSKDMDLAILLKKRLESKGITVWFAPDDIPPGSIYKEAIPDAIRESDGLISMVSENSTKSVWVRRELELAISSAESRNKQIIPLILDNADLDVLFLFMFSGTRLLKADTSDPKWPDKVVGDILQINHRTNLKARKYDELSELKKSGLELEASEKLTEIIDIVARQIDPHISLRAQYEAVIELDRCLGQLNDLYDFSYTPKAREVTERKLEALKQVGDALENAPQEKQDLFFVCCMIHLLYWDREIRWDCIDMITHGDLHDGIVKAVPENEYAEKQKEWRDIYLSADKEPQPGQPNVITEFIRDTEKYLYDKPAATRGKTRALSYIPSEKDEKLQAIARYIREGNRIFEMIGEDEKAADFLKCLITSYERLKNYCEEIGAREMTAECIARITELNQQYLRSSDGSLDGYTKAEKGIRALLGFTRPGTGTYDVFLSHKSYDIDIAEGVYRFLKSNMCEAFFDKISLPELSRAEYKDAILQALDKSKHFIAIISDIHLLEHLDRIDENDWVQREMDLFHSEIFEGRNKEGNFVILVTDEVFDEIVKHNKKNMDIKWRSYNLLRIREYKDQLMSYLT